jgi:hypothetical protein
VPDLGQTEWCHAKGCWSSFPLRIINSVSLQRGATAGESSRLAINAIAWLRRVRIRRSLPHGHAAAVLSTVRAIGLDRLIDNRKDGWEPQKRWSFTPSETKRLTGNELSDFSRLWHDGCGEAIIKAQDVDRNHSPEV